MFFPFMSSYTHLFGQQRRRSPWDEYSQVGGGTFGARPWETDSAPDTGGTYDSGTGDFRGFGSAESDRLSRRRALNSGLLAAGVGLLEGAGRGDWSGGLARGAAGFSEAFGAERDRTRREAMELREEQRRRAAEARMDEQERDRNRAADLSHEQGTAELDAWREQQDRGRQQRTRTGKSSEQMVSEINALAAANPKDPKLQVMAKRAAGYALGEDSDLNKLADLHDQMTGQAFRQQDVDFETGAGINRARAEITAGVRPDPAAAERRANEELGISRGHLGIARERAGREKEGLTDLQAYDRLEKKIQSKIDMKIQGFRDRFGREPGTQVMQQWRTEAMNEAMQEMQSGLDQVYRYTEDGRLVRE